MKRLAKHKDFLKHCAVNPSIVKNATLPEITCLVELLFNLSSIPFTGKEKRQLLKHIDQIKSIAKSTRERQARERLVQHGGAILPLAIPAALALARLLL